MHCNHPGDSISLLPLHTLQPARNTHARKQSPYVENGFSFVSTGWSGRRRGEGRKYYIRMMLRRRRKEGRMDGVAKREEGVQEEERVKKEARLGT